MSWKTPAEIITVAEALTRIGLASLIDEANPYRFQQTFVGWDGYPTPFACGHTGVYGFGPIYDESKTNDHKGSARAYQERVRVSQHLCSGDVLFDFPVYRKTDSPTAWLDVVTVTAGRFCRVNSSMVISIDTIPDYKSTCLKLGFTA
jgi:hypothetical protein